MCVVQNVSEILLQYDNRSAICRRYTWKLEIICRIIIKQIIKQCMNNNLNYVIIMSVKDDSTEYT